ncbi:MAG TPA: DUF6547 family protein [Verrucomicrobiae bacterium]|nr:DUF6547 family protein [Verrucomicrobiae bacterium]
MSVLDKFGQFIIENLRDKAIEQNEMLLGGKLKAKNLHELQQMVAALPDKQKDLIRQVVRDLLNTAIHDFLFALQDAHDRRHGIEVLVDGENIAEASGMLHGEHLGDQGWIERFSRFS